MEKMRESGIFHLFLRLRCFASDRSLMVDDYLGPAQTRRQLQWGQGNEKFGAVQSAGLAGWPGSAAMAYRSGGWGWSAHTKSQSAEEHRRGDAAPHVAPFLLRGSHEMPCGAKAMDDPAGKPGKAMDMSGYGFERTLPAVRLTDMVIAAFHALICFFAWTRQERTRARPGTAPAAFLSGAEEGHAPSTETPRRIRVRKLASFDELACMEAWKRSANDP